MTSFRFMFLDNFQSFLLYIITFFYNSVSDTKGSLENISGRSGRGLMEINADVRNQRRSIAMSGKTQEWRLTK